MPLDATNHCHLSRSHQFGAVQDCSMQFFPDQHGCMASTAIHPWLLAALQGMLWITGPWVPQLLCGRIKLNGFPDIKKQLKPLKLLIYDFHASQEMEVNRVFQVHWLTNVAVHISCDIFEVGSSCQVGDGSKPWYLVNPKIAGKWMFIPLKMVLIHTQLSTPPSKTKVARCWAFHTSAAMPHGFHMTSISKAQPLLYSAAHRYTNLDLA